MRFALVGQCVGHVVGQDQETFHQRGQQHHNHRERDVGNQIAKPATDRGQTKERQNRRHRRRKHRRGHASGGIFRRRHGVLSQTPDAEIGMFAHHDGVIHHNPQRDDQREQGNHVQRQTGGIHQGNRTEHRNRNTSGHPQCRARVQEQEQQNQNKAQPL